MSKVIRGDVKLVEPKSPNLIPEQIGRAHV